MKAISLQNAEAAKNKELFHLNFKIKQFSGTKLKFLTAGV